MGTSKDPCLAPDDPRNLWQFFNKIEQNDKKKWRSECRCCGQKSWDLSQCEMLDHFGYQSTRQTPIKFNPCAGIDKDEHKDVKATVQRIHAAEFAAKSALKLAKAQGSHAAGNQRRVFSRSWRECSSRSSKWPSPRQRVSYARSLRQPGAAQFKHQRGRITSRVREPRSTGGAVTEAVGGS